MNKIASSSRNLFTVLQRLREQQQAYDLALAAGTDPNSTYVSKSFILLTYILFFFSFQKV